MLVVVDIETQCVSSKEDHRCSYWWSSAKTSVQQGDWDANQCYQRVRDWERCVGHFANRQWQVTLLCCSSLCIWHFGNKLALSPSFM